MYENNSHTAEERGNSPVPGTEETASDIVVSEGESIQSAVNRAAAGDIVSIESGTFAEQVVVDRGITLQGAGTAETTIRAPESVSARFEKDATDYHPVISIEDDGGVVRSLTVDGDYRDVTDGALVGIGSHNATARVTDVEVRRIAALRADSASASGGIFAANDDGTRRLVRLKRCDVREYGQDGIVGTGDGLDLDVSNCEITGYGSTDEIAQNGVRVWNVSRATVVGNTIRDNVYTGDQLAVGILLLDTADAFLAWNVVENNNCGIGGEGDGDIVARRNNIRSNGVGAVNRGTRVFDARKNWWGALNGPSTTDLVSGGDRDPETGREAVGSGDAVYDVQWDPYSFSEFQLQPSKKTTGERRPPAIDRSEEERR